VVISVHLFDWFEGLPTATERDGAPAPERRTVHDYRSPVDMAYRIESLTHHFAAYLTDSLARQSQHEL